MEEESKTLSPWRWVIILVVCLLCFMANYMQYQVSALATLIMPDLDIDTVGFSMLFLAPMLAAVFLSIPMGTLGDRYGSKRVVFIMTVVSCIGGVLRCVAMDSFPIQMVSMFMLGCGIATLNANLIKVLGVWFKEQTGIAMGMFYAASCLGIASAQLFAGMFGSVLNSYIVAEVVMVACTALWFFLDRDVPKGEKMPEPEPTLKYLKVAAKSKGVWLVAVSVGLGMASTTAYDGMLPQALEIGRGIEMQVAGGLAAVITIGSFFGSLIGPALGEKIGKYKGFLTVVGIIAGVVMYACWLTPIGLLLSILLVINGIFTAMNGPIIQSLPILMPEIGPRYAGSAGGIIGTVSLLMSYFIPIAVSAIGGDNYTVILAIDAVLMAVSPLTILFMPELGPKGKLARKLAAEQADAPAEA